MKIGLINLCVCFLIAIIIAPFIIKRLKKLKFGQEILVYVEQHQQKSGTPTMGGLIFVFAVIVGYFIFIRENRILSTICLLSFLFFGVLGFLDDFIKIKLKRNEGLKPYQKIIGQVGLSLIIAIFVFRSDLVGSKIEVPFFDYTIDVGIWIIPFVVVFFVAMVNSVNLLDGLDGLCCGVSSVVLFVFSIILSILIQGESGVYFQEINNINILLLGVVGALFAFLCFNGYPAKVFMGDTGSLALGGLIASVATMTRQYFLICIIGVWYVLTALSVIIQVVVFKLTKRRVLKMSPLHHHFEVSFFESKVTLLYIILTIIIGLLTIMIYL